MYPVLFTIPAWVPLLGGQPIYSYGFMLGLAFVLGWVIFRRLALAAGAKPVEVTAVLLSSLVMGLFGARGLYLLLRSADWQGPSSLFRVDSRGMVLMGGLLVGLLAMAAVARAFRASFRDLADRAAPGFALGVGLGRLGCFLHGCDYGRETASVLGVRFPMWPGEVSLATGQHGSPPFLDHFAARAGPLYDHIIGEVARVESAARMAGAGAADAMYGAIEAFEAKFQTLGALLMGGTSNPVLPAQLFLAANGFIAFAGSMWLNRRRAFAGQVMSALVLYYGATRVLIDFSRCDSDRLLAGPLSVDQWMGVGIVLAAVVFWIRSRRNRLPGTGGRDVEVVGEASQNDARA